MLGFWEARHKAQGNPPGPARNGVSSRRGGTLKVVASKSW